MSRQDQFAEARPTLRSIAYLTGLGISTVSRALKDADDISVETRARVKLIAQQIGYRPNRAGVRLRTGKTNVISLVLNPHDNGSGFFANIVYGISDALADSPYHLVVTPYSLSDPMEPIRYIVETGSADGVIISRTQPDDPRVHYLIDNGMPFSTHGRTEIDTPHCYFDYDNEAYAIEALKQLKQRARKHVALISPPPYLTYYRHTQIGFERGLRELGMTGFLVGTSNSDSSNSELRKAGQALAEMKDRPDGFICVSSSSALAVVAGMHDKGLEIGRDFDLVAKPTSDIFNFTSPKIIFVEEDFRLAGRELSRMLMARIAGGPTAIEQKLQVPDASFILASQD
jgi:LacI family transcriptional regulator